MAGEALDGSYIHLVSARDRQREPSYSWSERVCEYGGWQGRADDLEQVLAKEDVAPEVPLLSSQYGISFAMAYYDRTRRPCSTVDDPRFRFLADFQEQASPSFPATALVVVHAGTPLPASLQALYSQQQLLVSVPRTAPGCASVLYQVFLLQPSQPADGPAVERTQREEDCVLSAQS